MDKQQLKESVGKLNLVDTVFEADGVSYIDTAVSVMQVYDLIDQLDEPEILSQEWIKQKLIDTHVGTLNGEVQVTFRLEDLQNLLVTKQELPVIPKVVADWIEKNREGYENKLFSIGYDLYNNAIDRDVDDWLIENEERFTRAWLDGYTVEDEPLYYALIKGHELVDSGKSYWTYDKNNDDVFISVLHSSDDNFLAEMSKEEWGRLGLNDLNADFIKVAE